MQIHFVVKMDNRLQYVSLTSSLKQAHSEKQGRDSAARDFSKMDFKNHAARKEQMRKMRFADAAFCLSHSQKTISTGFSYFLRGFP